MSESIPSLQLEGLDEKTKEPPKYRIKSASDGRKCFQEMQQQDAARGLMRVRHQMLLDGEPPLDPAVLFTRGQTTRTNVNWGDARAAMDNVESGMIDMNVSVETLVYVPLIKNAVPDDEFRFNLENILSEEVSATIRNWEEYDRNYLNLGRVTFWHGVGIAYFEDDIDWRFETTGLGDFVIPNGTKASENRIPVAGCLRWMELHELWAYIKDEEIGEAMGWNVQAVKEAILNACPEYRAHGWSINGWMRVQEELRSNDLGMSVSGRTAKVGLIHLWVREFDGTVSKCICCFNPPQYQIDNKKEPWLFEKGNIYEEMRRGLVTFTYSIGEHGTYHSISGLGRRIYAPGQALNRAMCNMLDAAIAGSGIFMQPENETSMSKMTLVPIGGGLTLLPAKEHGEMILRPMPDLSHGIAPIVQDFRNTIGQRAGQFQGDSSPFSTPTEKTRFEVAAQLEALGKVGATQINLWYSPWGRLMREVTRRMCRHDYDYSQPGGREVEDFHKRLQLRGFPLELLRAINFDGVRAEKAVGAGSGASRIGRLTQLKEYAGELGETGRHRLIRDLVAATLDGDYNQADRYIQREPEPLPPIDAQFAAMENMMAEMGQEPILMDGQMDFVHLQVHIPKILEMVQLANQDQEEMLRLAEPMLTLHTHAVDTLERVQDSVVMQQQVAQFRQILQNAGGIVDNAVRSSIAHHQQQMEEQGQAGEGMDEGNLKMLQRAAEAQVKLESMRSQANLKLQIEQEKHDQKMANQQQDFRQKAALEDAKTAGKTVSEMRSADLKRRSEEMLAQIKMKAAEKVSELKIQQMKRGNPRSPDKK